MAELVEPQDALAEGVVLVQGAEVCADGRDEVLVDGNGDFVFVEGGFERALVAPCPCAEDIACDRTGIEGGEGVCVGIECGVEFE